MLNNIRYVLAGDRDPINSHANASFGALSTLLLVLETGSVLTSILSVWENKLLSYFIH